MYVVNYYWRQDKKKLRNAFNNNILTDIKLSKAPVSKIN